MATGIEAAGLALASIPLIIALAEHYRAGIRPFRILRHFDREFQLFAVQIRSQNVIFRACLEKLLKEIWPATDVQRLMQDPGGSEWKEARLADAFNTKLGPAYDVVIDNVAEINRLMDELKRLSIRHGKQSTGGAGTLALPAPKSMPSKARLRFSFSRSKWENLVQLLERHNGYLDRLLQSSSSSGGGGGGGSSASRDATLRPSSRTTSVVEALRQTRERISCIHRTITRHWRCPCAVRHYSGLLLQGRSGAGKPAATDERPVQALSDHVFELLFVFSNSADELAERPWEWHESKIDVVPAGDDSTHGTLPAHTGGGRATGPVCAKLMPGVSLAADGNFISPLNGTAKRSGAAPVSTHLGNQTCHSKLPAPSSSEIDCLCSAIARARIGPPLTGQIHDDDARAIVRLHPVSEPSRSISFGCPIFPLEALLASTQPHVHDGAPNNTGTPMAAAEPQYRTRQQRLRAALVLASSYLQLHRTPWQRDRWSKRDIVVRPSTYDDSPLLVYAMAENVPPPSPPPFPSPNAAAATYSAGALTSTSSALFSSNSSTLSIANSGAAFAAGRRGDSSGGGGSGCHTALSAQEGRRLSLRCLGILLLELGFGQRLEDQPFRQQWQRRMPHAEWLDDATARHWQRSAYGEMGREFGRAVQSCISGDLEVLYPDPADFAMAVLTKVVQPIDVAVRQFEGVGVSSDTD